MSSRPITAQTVENYLREAPSPKTITDMMYDFIGEDRRHERRFKMTLEKLINKGVVLKVKGESGIAKMFGQTIATLFHLPISDYYYLHKDSAHENSRDHEDSRCVT